jgi:tetratricopeptide (TPR) repeat protein
MSVQPAAASEQALPDPKEKIAIFKLYREAIQLARTGQDDAAIAAYKRIVADNPQMVDVWERLATTLQRANRGDEAMLVLRRIIAIAPENTGAHLRLGRALVRRRRFDDAVAEARAGLARDPGQANELLARIAYERGSPDEAVKFAEAASHADPTLALPLYIQGLARYQRGQFADALPLFERAAANLQSRSGLTVPGLYVHLGDCLYRANRRDEAERAFTTEVKLYPDDLQARIRLGGFYLATAQKQRFVQLFTDLVREAPTPEHYQVAIRALEEAGETEAARNLAARRK